MFKFKRQYIATLILLMAIYPSGTAFAAAVEYANLIGLPWPQIIAGSAIALWGGLLRTAQRSLTYSQLKREALEKGLPQPQPMNIVHEVVSDILRAGCIALLAFAAGSRWRLGDLEMGGLIVLGGYMGPVLLTALQKRAVKAIKVLGSTNGTP